METLLQKCIWFLWWLKVSHLIYLHFLFLPTYDFNLECFKVCLSEKKLISYIQTTFCILQKDHFKNYVHEIPGLITMFLGTVNWLVDCLPCNPVSMKKMWDGKKKECFWPAFSPVLTIFSTFLCPCIERSGGILFYRCPSVCPSICLSAQT